MVLRQLNLLSFEQQRSAREALLSLPTRLAAAFSQLPLVR